MNRTQRTAAMIAAIQSLGPDAYLIFSDHQQPDNYVQLLGNGLIEATSRTYDGALPVLSPAQIDALVALEFSRTAHPNHQRLVKISAVQETAALCEQVFALLGSLPTFDLDVEQGE